MPFRFVDFVEEIEAEAREEGPDAVEGLAALRAHFRLGRQLFQARRAHSLTQKEVAKLAGIDQADVSNIERGAANPTLSTLSALARAVGMEIDLRVRQTCWSCRTHPSRRHRSPTPATRARRGGADAATAEAPRRGRTGRGRTEAPVPPGQQVAGADGGLSFLSIFPGCYPRRWPHIHLQVYDSVEGATTGADPVVTSQLALPAATARAVYATVS